MSDDSNEITLTLTGPGAEALARLKANHPEKSEADLAAAAIIAVESTLPGEDNIESQQAESTTPEQPEPAEPAEQGGEPEAAGGSAEMDQSDTDALLASVGVDSQPDDEESAGEDGGGQSQDEAPQSPDEDEEEDDQVHNAMQRVAALHGEGLGPDEIAAKLQEEGLPSPEGGPWNKDQVQQIVNSM
jgi:hypothetical protein